MGLMHSQMKSPYILSDEFYLTFSVKKVKSHTSQGDPHEPEPNRVSVARKNWEYCYSPLHGMLVHRRVTPSNMAAAPIYTPEWRETMWGKVSCLRKQESPRSIRTRRCSPSSQGGKYITVTQETSPNRIVGVCDEYLFGRAMRSGASDHEKNDDEDEEHERKKRVLLDSVLTAG